MKHPTDDSGLSLEKAKWVEEQVNRILDFRIESAAILRREAHTTLAWLYGIIVAASGFIVSHADKDQLFLIVPLGVGIAVAGWEAWLLISRALMARVYPSPGNVPSNIGTPENLARSEAEMRLSEAEGVEEIITELEKINKAKADALNRARMAVALIPAGTLSIIAVWWAIDVYR